MKDVEHKLTRLNRFINSFAYEMQEIYLNFLHGGLPRLINLNLLRQRSDPIIHFMYDALFDTSVTLLSRFVSPDIVTQYKNYKLSNEDIRIIVEDPDYYLPTNTLFVGFLARTQANKLLHDGTISENEYEAFFTACLNFHKTGFLYVLKNFPLDNELLQHARIFNFLNQKCSFESIQFLVEKLQHYVTFTPHEFFQLEEKVILLRSVTLHDFTESALSEATIRVDIDGDSKIYRIVILWHYLYMMKIPGTNKSKFENFSS